MSKSSKTKDYGGGHKGGGKDYGHKDGGKDYGGGHNGGNNTPDKVCKTDPQPNPQPQPTPPDNTDCRPVGDNDHHGAVISAGVDADVSANVLQCNSLLNLDADIDACVGLDLGNDSCLV